MHATLPLTSVIPFHLSPVPIGAAAAGGRRRQQADQQRAVIRAMARKLLAERGYDGFHINDLANRCGLAMQTLYNHIGGRDAILSSAVDELLRLQLSRAQEESSLRDVNFMLVYCEVTARMLDVDREYVTAVVSLVNAAGPHSPLVAQIEQRSVDAFAAHLTSLRASNALKDWVNIDTLATALHDMIRTIFTARVDGRTSPDRVRHELMISVGLLLHGATRGSEAERIEATLADLIGRPTDSRDGGGRRLETDRRALS